MMFFLSIIEDPEDQYKMEQIYLLYAKGLYSLALGILHDDNDAEDAVQTAMLNACKHVNKLSDPEDPNTKWYIMQATRNAAINLYNLKRKRWKKEMPLEKAIIGAETPPEYTGETELAKLIAKLPPRDRDILMLNVVQQYKYTEIAGILGMSKEATKKAGQRAKEKLMKAMRGESYHDG